MQTEVESVIRDVLRPLIEADGGTIELLSVESHIVRIRLSAACAGCPGVHYTRTSVIEPALREALGHDVEVVVERIAHPKAGG